MVSAARGMISPVPNRGVFPLSGRRPALLSPGLFPPEGARNFPGALFLLRTSRVRGTYRIYARGLRALSLSIPVPQVGVPAEGAFLRVSTNSKRKST